MRPSSSWKLLSASIHPILRLTTELSLLFERAGDKERARAEKAQVNALKSSGDKEVAIAKFYQEATRYLSAGDAKAAAESYRKALQLNPRDAKLHYNLSLALDKLGDLPSEGEELERTIQLDPNLAVAQNQLGLLALRRGQQTEAERRFKQALAIDPRFAEAQSNLGVLYSQQGKNAEAASLFQQAIKNDPRVHQGLRQLRIAHGTTGSVFGSRTAISHGDKSRFPLRGCVCRIGHAPGQDRAGSRSGEEF